LAYHRMGMVEAVDAALAPNTGLKIMLGRKRLISSLAEAYAAAWCSQNAASVPFLRQELILRFF
jgi:hypothetical protein